MLSEKRVFVFLLILVIALFGVSASSGYAEVDDKENTFELIFNKNVYLDDLESSNSLNWEDADIRDIQFEIVTAEDVLTIGYSLYI